MFVVCELRDPTYFCTRNLSLYGPTPFCINGCCVTGSVTAFSLPNHTVTIKLADGSEVTMKAAEVARQIPHATGTVPVCLALWGASQGSFIPQSTLVKHPNDE